MSSASSSQKLMMPPSMGKQNYWDRHCDPRTVHFWLMNHGPYKLLGFTVVYILVVIFGQRWMRTRKPLMLRRPMLAYNILMVVINAFFLYESLVWIDFGRRLWDFRFPSSNDQSLRSMRIVQMFYYYQWTKFIDYFDTFFFILRKKDNQISLLHIYHHISVPIIGWISSWISPTMPVLGLFAMLNCFVHVVMYSYYALASLGPHIQPYLWWKRYITQVQLIQFAIIGLYGLALNLFHEGYPLIYRMMPVTQAAIFLILFGQFYIRSYRKNQKKLLEKDT